MISGYGFESIYLDHAKLPQYYPFLPGYEHGFSVENIPSKHSTLKHLSKVYFCWGERVYKNILSETLKKPIKTGAPFLIFRKKEKIIKDIKKKTLFFPSHTTDKISQNLSPMDIHRMIEKVDNDFKPIDICLHWIDYKNDKSAYEKLGYNVLCAGKIFSNNFVKNFYNIIKNYEFSMSNKIGTYILYSLDLAIPFSLIGDEPIYFNHSGDKNKPTNYRISDYSFGKKVTKLFYGFNYFINENQKNFFRSETGYDSIISEKDLHKVLKDEFCQSLSNFRGFKNITKFYFKNSYLLLFK